MKNIYREEYLLKNANQGEVAKIIARHMFARVSQGRIIIIDENPVILFRIVCKYWKSLINSVKKERSRTLDRAKIDFLNNKIELMQQLEFSAKYENTHPLKDVYFLQASQSRQIELNCATLYIVDSKLEYNMLLNDEGVLVNLRS